MWQRGWVYLTRAQKHEAAITRIENKCEGDREMNGKYLTKRLKIFAAVREKIRNIRKLNSPKTILTMRAC